jgi:low affinity Fe/Cu permease
LHAVVIVEALRGSHRQRASAEDRTVASTSAPEPGVEIGVRDRFNRLSARLTDALGSFWALIASVLLVVVWALTGPIFKFSDTWQLFINTTTTVVTFWMVFVIQNSANRDAKAIHLKLDELLRVHGDARNELITLEQQPEEMVTKTAEELAAVAQEGSQNGSATVTLTEREGSGPASKEETVTASAKTEAAPVQDASTGAGRRPRGPRGPRGPRNPSNPRSA